MTSPARLRRFLVPAECRAGQVVILAPEQSRHMVTVLRLTEGRRVRIFTGAGAEYIAEIVQADTLAARVRIVEELQMAARVRRAVTLAFAPAPGNRSDIVIEKATELGVGRLVPLLCERLQGGEARAAGARAERWRRKAADAARQCRRADVPALDAPEPLERFVESAAPGPRIIAAGPDSPPLLGVLSAAPLADGPVSLTVGPAGGFTRRELALATDAGFQPVSLGPHVLRVETAALTLVAGVMLFVESV
jgi:16S rRNA (uracil1498-N3)-methyltransferase